MLTPDTPWTTTPTGHHLHLLVHRDKSGIARATQLWWQSQGWRVTLWDNTGHLPAVGRNRIIRHWRDTASDTTLFMADDDITLYTHRYLSQSFLTAPPDAEVYTLNSNQQMHHQRLNSTGWDQGGHHWSLTDQICKFYVINEPEVPLQDESLPALEDLDWAWQCADAGITTQRLNTVFLREQSMHTQSLFGPQSQRRELYAGAELQLRAKWGYRTQQDLRRQLGLI
jgi:hypothetical protein